MTRRSTRRAGAAAAVAVVLLSLGACGGGSDDDTATDDTTAETTETTDTPPPTFAPDREAAFLKASSDARAGKLGGLSDDVKLDAGRSACAALKGGLTGKDVFDEFRKEVTTADASDGELGFFFGTAVGAMCPEQQEQLKKGLE